MKQRRTPPIYLDAEPRAVLPKERDGIGISFDITGGETVRMFLTVEAAERFADALQNELQMESNK